MKSWGEITEPCGLPSGGVSNRSERNVAVRRVAVQSVRNARTQLYVEAPHFGFCRSLFNMALCVTFSNAPLTWKVEVALGRGLLRWLTTCVSICRTFFCL